MNSTACAIRNKCSNRFKPVNWNKCVRTGWTDWCKTQCSDDPNTNDCVKKCKDTNVATVYNATGCPTATSCSVYNLCKDKNTNTRNKCVRDGLAPWCKTQCSDDKNDCVKKCKNSNVHTVLALNETNCPIV